MRWGVDGRSCVSGAAAGAGLFGSREPGAIIEHGDDRAALFVRRRRERQLLLERLDAALHPVLAHDAEQADHQAAEQCRREDDEDERRLGLDEQKINHHRVDVNDREDARNEREQQGCENNPLYLHNELTSLRREARMRIQ